MEVFQRQDTETLKWLAQMRTAGCTDDDRGGEIGVVRVSRAVDGLSDDQRPNSGFWRIVVRLSSLRLRPLSVAILFRAGQPSLSAAQISVGLHRI